MILLMPMMIRPAGPSDDDDDVEDNDDDFDEGRGHLSKDVEGDDSPDLDEQRENNERQEQPLRLRCDIAIYRFHFINIWVNKINIWVE